MATDVRDKMSFSYRNGGSSLLDYLTRRSRIGTLDWLT